MESPAIRDVGVVAADDAVAERRAPALNRPLLPVFAVDHDVAEPDGQGAESGGAAKVARVSGPVGEEASSLA